MDFFANSQNITAQPVHQLSRQQMLLAYFLLGGCMLLTWSYYFYVQKNNSLSLIACFVALICTSIFTRNYQSINPIKLLFLLLGFCSIIMSLVDYQAFLAIVQSHYLKFSLLGLSLLTIQLWQKNQQLSKQVYGAKPQVEQDQETKLPFHAAAAESKLEMQQLQQQLQRLQDKLQQKENNTKKLTEELTQSYKDLELFAYVASHDLQEPLRMVGNFVQLLEKEYRSKIDTKGKEYIHYAVDGVNRMSKLIHSLLQFSRVGRRCIELKSANPEAILRNALVYVQSKKTDKDIVFNISSFPQKLQCEPRQLGIVFLHLLSNAIKFNHTEQIVINIEGEERENDFLFTIEDNGIGINLPEHKKAHIFEIFKKLNRKEDYEGTGIGLSLCQKIVKRHQGDIWYEAQKGKGSKFYFTIAKNIPSYKDEEEQEIPSSAFFQN